VVDEDSSGGVECGCSSVRRSGVRDNLPFFQDVYTHSCVFPRYSSDANSQSLFILQGGIVVVLRAYEAFEANLDNECK
jgi:hypothetical protein